MEEKQRRKKEKGKFFFLMEIGLAGSAVSLLNKMEKQEGKNCTGKVN